MNFKKYESSIIDALFVTIFVLTTAFILAAFDIFEIFIEFSEKYENYELDEIILVLLVGSFGGVWYSFRRYKEVKQLKQRIEKYNKNLREENLRKDDMLLEQAKMAYLGEMIENIAHQWRQPLSAISSLTSGLRLAREYIKVEEKDIDKTLDKVTDITMHLSQTIDSFKNYAKEKSVEKQFNINDNIGRSLEILESTIKASDINIVKDLNSNIEVYGYPNELMQVYMNVLNNAKDALNTNNIEDKHIFISTKVEKNYVRVKLYDNANGIPKKIIKKIFDPYFTTKHSSQGTGLGLYMSYKIIKEKVGGDIDVKNISFKHDKKKYKGAEFTIKIPLKKNHL